MLYRIPIVFVIVAVNWLKCKFKFENPIVSIW